MTTNELALELEALLAKYRAPDSMPADRFALRSHLMAHVDEIITALRPQPSEPVQDLHGLPDGDAVERVKQAISRAEIDKPQRSLSYYLGVGIDASGHDFARHDALITIAAQAAIAAMPAREGTVEHLCPHCAARVLMMDPAFLDQVDEALEQAGAPKSKMLSIIQKIEALSTMPAKGRDEVLEEADALRDIITECAADLSTEEPFWTAGMLADRLIAKGIRALKSGGR